MLSKPLVSLKLTGSFDKIVVNLAVYYKSFIFVQRYAKKQCAFMLICYFLAKL